MRILKFRAWQLDQKIMIYSDKNHLGTFFDHTIYTHEACEIMQFIGDSDKNGNEIYDKDIMESNKGKHFLVVYSEAKHRWSVKALFRIPYLHKNIDHSRANFKSMEWAIDNCIVKGNLHENKELFERTTTGSI